MSPRRPTSVSLAKYHHIHEMVSGFIFVFELRFSFLKSTISLVSTMQDV